MIAQQSSATVKGRSAASCSHKMGNGGMWQSNWKGAVLCREWPGNATALLDKPIFSLPLIQLNLIDMSFWHHKTEEEKKAEELKHEEARKKKEEEHKHEHKEGGS